MVMVPFWLMLAPTTSLPTAFSTGMLSPVSMDSSTAVWPYHYPIDRDTLSRLHKDEIAHFHFLNGDHLLLPGHDHRRCLGANP